MTQTGKTMFKFYESKSHITCLLLVFKSYSIITFIAHRVQIKHLLLQNLDPSIICCRLPKLFKKMEERVTFLFSFFFLLSLFDLVTSTSKILLKKLQKITETNLIGMLHPLTDQFFKYLIIIRTLSLRTLHSKTHYFHCTIQ